MKLKTMKHYESQQTEKNKGAFWPAQYFRQLDGSNMGDQAIFLNSLFEFGAPAP